MRRFKAPLAAAMLGLAFAAAAKMASAVEDPVAEAQRTIATFKKSDPSIEAFFERSAGFVVFPVVTKGAVGIGGAHGKGVAFERGKPIGYASLTQISVGAQIG